MKTRLFSLWLLLSVAVGLSAYGFKVDGLCYNITSSTAPYTVEVTYEQDPDHGYGGQPAYPSLTTANIPESVTYNSTTYRVTSISSTAFKGCTSLTSITIPCSVTSIEDYTFEDCPSITSVVWNVKNGDDYSDGHTPFYNRKKSSCYYCTEFDIRSQITFFAFGDSVQHIPDYLCAGMNNLDSITISNSVTSIGSNSFKDTRSIKVNYKGDVKGWLNIDMPGYFLSYNKYLYINNSLLTELTIPDGVTHISPAFSRCSSLTSLTIPNSVTSIGEGAFEGCMGLTSITIPNSVTSIGESAFSGCTGLSSITIGNNITSIWESAFEGCWDLTSITIPNSVTSIGESAFSDCRGLTSVTIGNSVTSIGKSVFEDCSSLTSITIGNSVTSIGNLAFYECRSLATITIPNSVTSIGKSAFEDCWSLTSITIPNSVTSIGQDAFAGCTSLASITIPNSVTSIGESAFRGCNSLTSLTIPNSVTSIGEFVFKGCTSLTSVVWNAKNCSDFSIYDTPFYYEGYYSSDDFDLRPQITSFIFGDSVQYIPNYLLNGLKNITSITIPSSVTSIGKTAFKGSSITSVVWNAKNCNGFSYDNTPFYYLDDNSDASNFDIRPQITSFVFGDSVQHIPNNLCNGMENLTSITIPNHITSIGEYAFSFCKGLTSITIPNSVTSIGSGAFSDCTGLAKVNYIGDVKGWLNIDMRDNLLYYVKDLYINNILLTELIIPNGVTYISSAFSDCRSITSVTIPNSVTSIGSGAFSGCTGLTSITIPNSVTSIESGAFRGCRGLISITIPDNVTSIGNSAFTYCTSLTSISIGNSVTSIGDRAFSECRSLTSVIWNAKACSKFEWNNTPFYHNEYDSWKQYLNFDVRPQITSFVFGDSVQYIPDYLCAGMVNLTSTNIPKNVTNIGEGAFKDCSNLKTISIKTYYPPKLETTEMDSWEFPFNGVKKHINIYIPCGAGYNFRWKQDWRYFEGNSYVETPLHHKITAQPQDSTLGIVKIVQTNTCDNDTTIIVAEANEHYRFAQWNDGNTDNPRKVVVVGDTTYIAEFVLLTNHTIIGTCNSIQGSVTGGGTYQYGDIVTLTATPAESYQFSQWTDGNKDNPRKVTVTADATYTAEFALQNYVVSATCDPQHGQVTGGGTYPYGSEVTLTATANEGYEFTQWSDGNKDNPRKVTVTADATYTAEFALQNYVVSATCDSQQGQVTGGGTYPYGSEVTLTAVPNEGYAFTQWGDGNKDNPRKVTVNADATYTAEFALQNYVVSATCDPQHGQVTGGGTYPHGSEVTIMAIPNEGYAFTQWSDGNKDNPRKVTVTADATYTAEFALQNYVVSATCDPQQGQVTGGGTYLYGSEVTLTAVPHDGYTFKQWSDGTLANPYSFPAEKDVNIEALFEPTTPVENVAAEENDAPRKVFRNGQVYILRNGKTYTLTGVEVK